MNEPELWEFYGEGLLAPNYRTTPCLLSTTAYSIGQFAIWPSKMSGGVKIQTCILEFAGSNIAWDSTYPDEVLRDSQHSLQPNSGIVT
jgi:hypothetical protein